MASETGGVVRMDGGEMSWNGGLDSIISGHFSLHWHAGAVSGNVTRACERLLFKEMSHANLTLSNLTKLGVKRI